jgi:hypothetical protein
MSASSAPKRMIAPDTTPAARAERGAIAAQSSPKTRLLQVDTQSRFSSSFARDLRANAFFAFVAVEKPVPTFRMG